MWGTATICPPRPAALEQIEMAKDTTTYWNPLAAEHGGRWAPVEGLAGQVEELTLAADPRNGEVTRLTRFGPGADTRDVGVRCHDYPEEVFIVSGRVYDEAFDTWLEAGYYASRPPGEAHGPFRSDVGCVVLEVSRPTPAREAWPGPGI